MGGGVQRLLVVVAQRQVVQCIAGVVRQQILPWRLRVIL
jgi:hypothetical protein